MTTQIPEYFKERPALLRFGEDFFEYIYDSMIKRYFNAYNGKGTIENPEFVKKAAVRQAQRGLRAAAFSLLVLRELILRQKTGISSALKLRFKQNHLSALQALFYIDHVLVGASLPVKLGVF